MTDNEMKWAVRIREWKESGKSPEEFAQGQGYEGSTIRYWASRLRRAQTATIATGETAPSISTVRMARVAPSKAAIENTLAVSVGDAVVHVRPGFDGTLLREIVAALRATA